MAPASRCPSSILVAVRMSISNKCKAGKDMSAGALNRLFAHIAKWAWPYQQASTFNNARLIAHAQAFGYADNIAAKNRDNRGRVSSK